MSIQPPNGILDITGATLRVSKMEFSNVTGFDTVLNNVARNTVLHVDTTEYTANVAYAVKPPNMFMAQFDLELAAGGTGLPCNFNYYNDSNLGTSFNGYNLSFNDTSIILTYDGGSALHTATLSSSLNNGVYRKVKVLFDRDTTLVSINGENVFRFKDELRPRTYDTGTTGYIRWWHNSPVARKIKNLKVSNGEKWAQEYDSAGLSSNISYTHGLVGVGTSVPEYTLDVAGDIRASGNLIINGSNTLINTTSLAIEDGVIECGKGNSSAAKDLGFLMVRNDGSSTTNSNVAMFWDESTDALTFGFSDSGPTATTLTPNTTKTLNSYFVGNVGIGTASPESALDISSTSGLMLRNTSNKTGVDDRIGYIEFYNGETGGGNRMSSAIEACVNAGGLNNNSDLRFKTTLDYNNPLIERMRIDRGGNVGIGTEDPDEKLHVYGSIKCHNTGTTGDEKGLFLHSTSDWYNFSPGNDGYLHLLGGASGQGHMSGNYSSMKLAKLIAQGNVGINGSASPQQALEVHGNILLGENNVSSFIHGGSHTAMTSDANILIVADSNDTSGATGGNIIFGTGSNVNMDSSRNCTFAQAFPDNLPRVEHMRIVGSSGKVGIGTATPYAKLQVDIADASAASATWDATKVVFGDITNGNSQGLGFGVSTNSHASIISLAPGVAWRGLGYYSAWHKWYINNVEKMALDASGNVGIGTASPGSLLTFYKDYTVPANGSEPADDTTQGITFRSDLNSFGGSPSPAWSNSADAVDTAKIWFQPKSYQGISGSAGVHGYLAFGTGYFGSQSNTPDMVINTGGNVGIGTANPAYNLDVYSNHASDPTFLRLVGNSSDRAGIILGENTSTSAQQIILEYDGTGTGVNNRFQIYSNESAWKGKTEGFTYIPETGRVGIGTQDPGGMLHVCSGTSGDCHLILQSDTDNNNEQDNPKIVFRQDGAINTAEIGIENSGNMLAIRGTSGIVFYDGSPSTSDIDHIENTSTERMRINANGNVGIGTGSPYSTLSLRPTTIYNSQSGSSFTSAMGGLEFVAANNTNARWNLTVHDNNDLYFLYTTSGTSNWGIAGYLADNAVVDQITFTGQHRSFIDGVPYTEYDSLEGLIVSANKNKYFDIDEDLTTGANAIQISQSLPLVSLTTKEKDKACFGVISGSEDPESREYVQGSFVSVVQKQNGDRRAFINSVGEGAMWVTDINGPLESGDYITTSNVAGYGMKQDSEFLANYTVAKITMDCDFEPVTQPVQQIVKELSNVNYWVTTTYKDVALERYSNLTEENRQTITTTRYSNEEGEISPGEYSNLESNVQATYSEIETTTYQQIERTESKTEQEGYTLEVREELVNVLDEHGQLQWEDHPTETEKAYKIRYLDADGKITTEANKVYTAAFVGCTYHCG